ncbi:Pantothenic acid transporter PanT [Clostridiales bacterium CHKCI001]|nr:Pantothenic acid transporter PanT [Clostridiales bacterium CHKCI001]
MNISKKTQEMVLTAIFAAIIIAMANIPYLGYLNFGVVSATLIHIPVIIGAILIGPKAGAFLGFVFGATSLIRATFQPNLSSFAFSPFYAGGNMWSLVICFVPRILIGIVSYYVFYGLVNGFKKHKKENKKRGGLETISLLIAGIAGSMTNTLLVMNLIFVFFSDQYGAVQGVAGSGAIYKFIVGVIVVNGIPEAIIAGILTAMVCKVMLKVMSGTRFGYGHTITKSSTR